MNRKQLTIIIVAGILLGALGLVMYQKKQGSWTQSARPRERLVPGFPLNDVALVTVKQGTNELNLVKKDDQWLVKERADFPANFGDITDLLRKLWEMKGGQPVQLNQSQLPRLELLPPNSPTNAATLVEFKGKDGKSLCSLLLGKKHMKKSAGGGPDDMMGGGGAYPDGRYVMVGADLSTVCLVSETFANLEPKADAWLDKDFVKVEKTKSVALVSPTATNSWSMARETESADWKLANATPAEQLDTVKASSAATAMASPSINDVVPLDTKPEVTGLDKATTATLETFDGFTYTFKFGNKTADDNGYYVSVNVAANLPKERTPGKDEKKEDKDKLDKEFKDSQKKLEEKLAKEKKLAGWNYTVSKWSVESLLKPRAEMLAAKKEEEKKPDAKPEEKPAEEKK